MGITAATGGLCYKPQSITEALKILEQERVIALSERDGGAHATKPLVSSMSQLLSYASGNYVAEPVVAQPRCVCPAVHRCDRVLGVTADCVCHACRSLS